MSYKIGWWPKDTTLKKNEWGIVCSEDDNKMLWIPAGIIIPSLDKDGSVQRIKVRRIEDDAYGKYIVVSGSAKSLTSIGSFSLSCMIIVESELDAYALHHAVGDVACIVSVGSNIRNPDNIIHFYAQEREVLICPDNDEGGRAMSEKWKKLYPHATIYPTPFGKDIGEAIEQGLKIRPWILQYKWRGNKDQELIDYILKYIDKQQTAFRPYYTPFEEEIFLGPDSPRAKSRELQEGLRLMKELIEKELSESV